MSITRLQQVRQMYSTGQRVEKAIKSLKKNAPKGEFLAYINPKEAAMLKKAGGSGELVNGIPSYRSKRGMESKAKSRSYSSPSKSFSPSPRGPQELGTSTRTVNRITAPPPTTRIGGETFNVTPETRGERNRAELKQQILNQTKLGGNRIDRFGNTKKSFFPQGSGGLDSLLMGALGMFMGIPGLGLITGGIKNLGSGFKDFNRKMRGVNPDGTTRTQAEYEQARFDRQQQKRLDKLFAAKDRGYNTLTPFGKFKTTDFTPGQQAKIDELMALGYMPSTARNVDSGRGSGLRGDINNLESLVAASQRPQSDFEYLGSNFNDGQLMDYQDIGIASDSYNYPDRRQLVNSGTITPLEDDFIGQQPQDGIMGIDVGYPSNDLMAFAPNSKNDRALKNLYSGYENLGIKDPQMIDLMQQDLQENKEKGTPLSLPQNAYSLIG